MPRKRIIDPEFWSDEEVGAWPYEARLFYIACWNFADDAGRMKAHSSLLKSQIFPYDMRIDIEKLKNTLSSKIKWYTVNGSQYGVIRNFLKHQRIDRPSPSKLPIPPQISEDSSNVRGHVPPNTTKDKLIEDKLSKVNTNSAWEEFESIWCIYPKRIGKKEAERHFKAQIKNQEDLLNIKKALENYLKSDRVKRGFIQNGSTWFNNWRDWIDYKEGEKPVEMLTDTQKRNIANFNDWEKRQGLKDESKSI